MVKCPSSLHSPHLSSAAIPVSSVGLTACTLAREPVLGVISGSFEQEVLGFQVCGKQSLEVRCSEAFPIGPLHCSPLGERCGHRRTKFYRLDQRIVVIFIFNGSSRLNCPKLYSFQSVLLLYD